MEFCGQHLRQCISQLDITDFYKALILQIEVTLLGIQLILIFHKSRICSIGTAFIPTSVAIFLTI